MPLTEAVGGPIVVIIMRALRLTAFHWGRVELREISDVAEFS